MVIVKSNLDLHTVPYFTYVAIQATGVTNWLSQSAYNCPNS